MKKRKLSKMSVAAISVGSAAVVTTAVVTPILLIKDNSTGGAKPLSPKRQEISVAKWIKTNTGYLSHPDIAFKSPFDLPSDNSEAMSQIEELISSYVFDKMSSEEQTFEKDAVSVEVTSYIPPRIDEKTGTATYTITYGRDGRYTESYPFEISFAETSSQVIQDYFASNLVTTLDAATQSGITVNNINILKNAIDSNTESSIISALNSIMLNDNANRQIWAKIGQNDDSLHYDNVQFVNFDPTSTNYTISFDIVIEGIDDPITHTVNVHTNQSLEAYKAANRQQDFEDWYQSVASRIVMKQSYLSQATRPVPTIADVDTSVLDTEHVVKAGSFNYTAPTGDQRNGVVSFVIESPDHAVSVTHTINVPFTTSPNEDVLSQYHDITVTTPIATLNADTFKDLSLLSSAQRPASLLSILSIADATQDFTQATISNVVVDSINDDTTKNFHVAFDVTLGQARKTINLTVVTANTVNEVLSSEANTELNTWYAAHSSEIVVNPTLDLTNPRAITLSNIIQTPFNADYSIKANSFVYTAPVGDSTTGSVSLVIEHHGATKTHTINVEFDNSPNQVIVNAFTDLTKSGVISNYDADDVMAFEAMTATQQVTALTALLKANYPTMGWDNVTISNCSVDQHDADAKTFTYNFTVTKGTATKDISFTFTTQHSSAELAAAIELNELNQFVTALQENVLLSTVDLSEPHAIAVGDLNLQLFTTGFTVKSGSFNYVAPANDDSNTAQISFVVQHGSSEVTVTRNIEFDQTANEALANKKVYSIGTEEAPTTLVKLPQIQSIHDDFDATKTDAQRVAILRDILAKGGISDFDGKTIQNVLTPDDFDGDAEPHVITFDCVEGGVTKTYTLNVYVKVSVLDYWEGLTNEQAGQITTLTPEQQDHVKSHISTKDITKEAADAAWQIRELMANDPNAAWHPIGDSVIDGFNAIRYVIYKDAWGDYQPKQLLDQFLRSAFPELRFAGDGEKEKVLIHMLIAAGHSEFINASFRNIMLAKEYLPSETSATVTFDAKLPGESTYTSYTFNVSNFAPQLDADNPHIQSSVGSAGIAQLGAGEHSAQDWIDNMGGHFYAGNVKFQLTSHFDASLDNPFAPFDPALDTGWGNWMSRSGDGARTVDDAQTYLIRPTGDSTEGRIEGRLAFHGTRYYQQIMVQYNISPNQYLMNQTQDTLDVAGTLSNISGYDIVRMVDEQDPVNQSLQMRRIAESIGIINAEKYIFNDITVKGRAGATGAYSTDELEKADNFEIVTTAQLGGATQEITIHFAVQNTKEELETDDSSELLAMINNYWTNSSSIVVDDSFDLDRVAPDAMSASDIDVSGLGSGYSIDPASFRYIKPFENSEKGYVTFDIVNSTNADFRMTHSMEVNFTKTEAEVAASTIQNHQINFQLETVNVGDSPSIAGVDYTILNQVDPTRIISGEDLLILSNIQYHPSYSVLACQQINDWLDGKTTSFPLTDTGMGGGDTHWMHGPHADGEFMNHLMVFDPSAPNPNGWVDFKKTQPMRMGVQEMIFAQERGQAIDYVSQGFDMHQAGDTFDAIAGTKTWAQHATDSMHNVGTTGQGWSTWAGKPVFTKEHVSAYDNFLIPYDYSVEGVKVNNTLGMDFIEGMMSGINTFYDNADGSRSGGHRTSVFNALNDTMGWSFTYCGDHVYIMVEVNNHFEPTEGADLPLTGDDAYNREFIAPVPLTAISTAEINRKYPWLVPVFGEKADDALGLVGEEIFFKEVLGLNTMVYKQGYDASASDTYSGWFWDKLTNPSNNADWLADFQGVFVGQTNIPDRATFEQRYMDFVATIIPNMGVNPDFKPDADTHLDAKFDEWIASGADVLAQKNAENLENARYQYARHWEDSVVQEVAVAPRISRGYNINGGGTLVGSIIGYDEYPDEIYNH